MAQMKQIAAQRRRAKVITESESGPVKFVESENNDSIKEIELRENPEFESALDELNNIYPQGTEGIECRIYKKENNQKVFLMKLEYFPDESEVKEKCGSGTFILYCFIIQDGKRRFLKSPTVNIGIATPQNSAVPVPIETPSSNNHNGVESLLEQLRAFREAGLIQQPNAGNGENFIALVNMMNEQNKANQTMLLKLLELNSKPEKTRDDKILEVLLTKALDKSDPMKEINTILKIKESLANDAAPDGEGSSFSEIIKIAAPLIQLAAANSAAAPSPKAVPVKIQNPASGKLTPAEQKLKMKSELIKLIGPEIKELMKDAIHEYNQETEPAPDETPGNDSESDSPDLNNYPEPEAGNMELVNNDNSNNLNQNQEEMLKGIAEQIKAAPEENKISTLKFWLEQLPVADVKNFIMSNHVVETEAEFWEYVKKAGRPELVPDEFKS